MNKNYIRFATVDDAKKILSIYEPYIKNTPITLEYVVPSLEDFTDRIKNISRDYPYLVCETDGQILGYAYANRSIDRSAYDWNVELSVYVDENYRGHGIGKALYRTLFEILYHQNIQNVYALVVSPNKSSEKLHENFGFSVLGIHPKSGYKLGKWHDLAFWGKSISDYDNPPKPFIGIKDIDKGIIEKVFNNKF